jgi:hypothetical protein
VREWCELADKESIPTPSPTKKREITYATYRKWYEVDPHGVCNEFLRIEETFSEIFPS